MKVLLGDMGWDAMWIENWHTGMGRGSYQSENGHQGMSQKGYMKVDF